MEQLLTTKLYIPQLHPDTVPRPHLYERLDEGLTRKLTLVSAPAGSGKTTLIAEWCQQADHPITWLSLDKNDNDPIWFLSYLIATIKKIDPDVCQSAQA